MDTQRLILFVVLSFSILMLWGEWQKDHSPRPPVAAVDAKKADAAIPATPKPAVAPPVEKSASAVKLDKGQIVKVTTDRFYAEIDTAGGDIRHLELRKYKDSEDNKRNFVLLEDKSPRLYVAQSGLLGGEYPTHKSQYVSEKQEYVMGTADKDLTVSLVWQNEKGVKVTKRLVFHAGSYVVDVIFDIENGGPEVLAPSAYFQVLRDNKPPRDDPKFIQTYTGAAVYTEKDKFNKISFSDIEKNKENYPRSGKDGWISMLQHYFLTAWLPPENVQREYYVKHVNGDIFSIGLLLDPAEKVAQGQKTSISTQFYAGPQEQTALNALAKGLDLSVDYGWLTIIASPLYWVMAQIQKYAQNWGVTIILLTVLIKLAFFPLSAKSYRSMAHMRQVTPKLQKLKELYGDDREKLHKAMMELYRTEKINPLGGCLPILVQIPVFIALYWVLLYSVEIRQAPFALWIMDLSAPDPFYVLPVLMGITMFVQTKLNPTPPDPVQAKVMLMMPVMFTAFFLFFPSGLVLYWVVNNILSIAQQWQITRMIEAGARK